MKAMSKGFIFNHEKCVGCGSCGAACILENGWTVRPRNIITFNGESTLPHAVINLSLSCNHCGDPVCLKGCPSKAYHKDEATGAVIIDDVKCLGCRYCQWNCPFDAPRFDQEKRVIGKCNLCYSSLEEGRAPACASSCPTGALSYGEIINKEEDHPEWFPGQRLNPSIQLTGDNNPLPLRIIPASGFSAGSKDVLQNRSKPEWSLLVFSFLVTIAFSIISASLIKGVFPSPFLVFPLIIISGIASLFHLGKPLRAWRSVMNIRNSPLSREIALFIISSLLTTAALLTGSSGFLAASVVSGLLTLTAIDNVYTMADRNRSITLHSGQTFLTGLLIISFLAGSLLPFTFVALIKLFLLFFYGKFTENFIILRFIRTALLLIVMSGFISGFAEPDLFMTLILLSGEVIERFLFYADFEPENIKKFKVRT
jgi:Fe-S-cluster-containing dehydrogenase component/DMSO reductase anchor subunit